MLIVDHEENNLARGLSSFPLMKLLRSKVNKVMRFSILGYPSKSEIIHKDDMVIL